MRDIPLMKVTQKLEAYVMRGRTYPIKQNPAFSDSLAIVAFQSYRGNDNKNQVAKARDLTKHLLAATIESLLRAGFGRTVIVGIEPEDEVAVTETLKFVYPAIRNRNEPAEEGTPSKLGQMEVGFVLGNSTSAKTLSFDKNVPKAALQGLQDALKNKDRAWIGGHEPEEWKFIYFTEADNILQTRPGAIHALKQKLEEGAILVPHRFQPIPHQRDVTGAREKHLYLPAKDKDFNPNAIMELDALYRFPGICCDEQKGPKTKPGLTHGDCGKPWYKCDFDADLQRRNHDRLRHYNLIRLTQGSQMILLSASQSGRRCVPPKTKLLNHQVCSIREK